MRGLEELLFLILLKGKDIAVESLSFEIAEKFDERACISQDIEKFLSTGFESGKKSPVPA